MRSSGGKESRGITPNRLSLKRVQEFLADQPLVIGKELLFFASVDSTNTMAFERAAGRSDGLIILADSQTAGRGRRGRQWLSPSGSNLYMTILMKPSLLPEDAPILTLMAAVSATSAIKNLTTIPASIKWPNDIMVGERKLGGILTEVKVRGNQILWAAIGIGINVNITAKRFPEDIRPYATSMRHETGRVQSRTLVVIEILKELDSWYRILLAKGKEPLFSRWLIESSTIGRNVRVTVGRASFVGVAEGIDDTGMLMLRLRNDSIKKISSGDVVLLREATA